MTDLLFAFLEGFRPTDSDLSPRRNVQVQMYRLVSLLGAVLFPVVGLMHTASMGGSLAMSGMFAGLLGGSYVFKRIRRHYVGLVWGMLYLTTAWITTLTALNQFSGTYSAVFLSAYALFGGIVALGSASVRPVLYYRAAGILFAGGALLGAQAFETSPLMLIGGMVVVAILESGAALWAFSSREQMTGQDGLFGRAQDL